MFFARLLSSVPSKSTKCPPEYTTHSVLGTSNPDDSVSDMSKSRSKSPPAKRNKPIRIGNEDPLIEATVVEELTVEGELELYSRRPMGPDDDLLQWWKVR